jgi:putative sigma-54 modulation protein
VPTQGRIRPYQGYGGFAGQLVHTVNPSSAWGACHRGATGAHWVKRHSPSFSFQPSPPKPDSFLVPPRAGGFAIGVFSPRDISQKEVLMNLTISGHHLEVTPALREYVLTKLERVTRHFDQVVDVTVLLTVEKMKEKERRQKAEVTLHVKGRDIVEQSSEDLYAAIDQLMDKLDRQVVRHKDRLQNHHHESPKRADISAF